MCGEWLADKPRLPVIACGMLGSTLGWKETAYVQAPVSLGDLAGALATVDRKNGKPVHIVPGISMTGIPGKSFPEIMRGEETKIMGVVSALTAAASPDSRNLLVGMPGTHSKWARVKDGQLLSFSTFVTGELYGLLLDHSVIVGPVVKKPGGFDDAAFQRGLSLGRAQSQEAAGGLLSTIFSTRTMRVLGDRTDDGLTQEQQPHYLSGLLIGDELAGVERTLKRDNLVPSDFSQVILAGERNLCQKYQTACLAFCWPAPRFLEGAVERGLWSVARAARLVQ
jgi:2-dehydro-3-deoxygalactonokinase